MFQVLEILPFEVLQDAEVYGQAVSALAEIKPLNKESKVTAIFKFMYMFTVVNVHKAG